MVFTAQARGHIIFFDQELYMWLYDDSGMPFDETDERPCKRCGRYPTAEGYDACLGHIEGATSACCGHGVHEKIYNISRGNEGIIMAVLNFGKPKKIHSMKEHNEMHSSDCGVPGTFAPNMSEDDMYSWKAKLISGNDPRVEIRKTMDGEVTDWKGVRHSSSAQMLIVVREEAFVLSANGKVTFTDDDFDELQMAVEEAKNALRGK